MIDRETSGTVFFQDKLRRELNKARFQAGHLRNELQQAQTIIASSKEAEQMRVVSEENSNLKLQVSNHGLITTVQGENDTRERVSYNSKAYGVTCLFCIWPICSSRP